MKHFQIFLLIANLLAGLWVIIFILGQYRKYRQPLLLSLLRYSISFNLLVLVDLSYKYIMSNIFGNQFFSIPAMVSLALFILVIVAEFGITYTLFLVTAGLKGKKVSNRSRYLFISWFAVFAILTAFGIFQYFRSGDSDRIYVIHEAWIFSMIIIILTALALLLIFSIRKPGQGRKQGSGAFSIIFLAGYALFTLSQLDFYFFRAGIEDFDPLILLLINLLPAAWLYFFYTRHQKPVPAWPRNTSLKEFAGEYNITARELEIIELIMDGKSNKEIESELFISSNTVKNHIYSIYQKAKVNSRTQLLQKIRQHAAQTGLTGHLTPL